MLLSSHYSMEEARIIWGRLYLKFFVLWQRKRIGKISGYGMNYIISDVINFVCAPFLKRYGHSSTVISSSGSGLVL